MHGRIDTFYDLYQFESEEKLSKELNFTRDEKAGLDIISYEVAETIQGLTEYEIKNLKKNNRLEICASPNEIKKAVHLSIHDGTTYFLPLNERNPSLEDFYNHLRYKLQCTSAVIYRIAAYNYTSLEMLGQLNILELRKLGLSEMARMIIRDHCDSLLQVANMDTLADEKEFKKKIEDVKNKRGKTYSDLLKASYFGVARPAELIFSHIANEGFIGAFQTLNSRIIDVGVSGVIQANITKTLYSPLEWVGSIVIFSIKTINLYLEYRQGNITRYRMLKETAYNAMEGVAVVGGTSIGATIGATVGAAVGTTAVVKFGVSFGASVGGVLGTLLCPVFGTLVFKIIGGFVGAYLTQKFSSWIRSKFEKEIESMDSESIKFEDVYSNALKVLEVKVSSTNKDIRKRRRILLQKYHPDKNQNHEVSTGKYIEVCAAFEMIRAYRIENRQWDEDE